MVKRHEKVTVVYNLDSEEYLKFFTDSTKVVCELTTLDRVFKDFENNEIDEDEVYDALDELDIPSSTIHSMAASFSSVNNSRNKYLRKTSEILKVFMDNVLALTEVGRSPDEDDVVILKKELFEVVGGLTYFLMHDFEVFETLEQIKNGESNYSIDEVFDAYLKKEGLSIADFAEMFLDVYNKYKYKLELFDEYPELETEFEKIVGPDYNLIPEGTLTIELVQQIINGTKSIEEFLAQFEAEEEV